MAKFTQQQRHLSLTTPLGQDVLLLTSFSGVESLSRPFQYQLDMVSEDPALAARDIVGKSVTWSVGRLAKEPRFFNGFVSRFSAGGISGRGLRSYRAEVVPWLWFLSRTANCRIFQEKDALEIVTSIFDALGFSDYEPKVKRKCAKRTYCVQYRETAFNFVSRMLEHEGIYYYFRHEDGKHTLVLSDHVGGYADCAEGQVQYSGGSLAPNHIGSWLHEYEFRPGAWAQTDYNFETPSTPLLTTKKTTVDIPGMSKFELFDYPGDYLVKAEGEALSELRIGEEEAGVDVVSGTSNCATFTPGGKFTVAGHEVASEAGKTYVVTSVQHTARDTSFSGTDRGGDYSNSFTCIPATIAFRPPRLVPRPVVQGPQTAVVVGPPGEEIYKDKYGRIKVQFFWDRVGQKNEKSSCWVRVTEAWAGKGWGMVSTPRIGQEVVVDFLEGDPDRPLVTGRIYNAEQMPPYGPDTAKSVTGFKSNSTPGGGGYNEISITDTKGKEQITIHGQYDMNTTVENNQTTTVHNNRTDKIDVDDSETVGANQTIKIGADQTIDIGSNQKETIGSNQELSVGADQKEVIGAKRDVSVGADDGLAVGGAQTIHVTGKVHITSDTSIELTVADSGIKIEPGKITVKTGGTVIVEGGAKVEVKSALIVAEASGVHELKGSTIKLN